jgi:alginate O-acetyltransferase complex protein AlgI
MLFTSLTFPLFLIVFLTLYWLLETVRSRTILLLAASYVFYGWWDYRYLLLLVATSTVTYFCSLAMSRTEKPAPRKGLLAASLLWTLGSMGVFKYCDFFRENFTLVLASMGIHADWPTINLFLPLGISFYSFQALTYVFDVYRRKCEPCRDIPTVFLFVSFFPTVLAGPIQKARDLIPQLKAGRRFCEKQAVIGLRCILWGFMLKAVLADNLAPVVGKAFHGPQPLPASEVLLGVYAFSLQIYGDFAGYSYIAIGTAALFGFKLSPNFRSPYLAQSVKEFWARWHIALTSWFRDYVYIFWLGGNKVSRLRHICNVLATFALIGLWHGASWNFIIWGLLNGMLYFLPRPFQGRSPVFGLLNALLCFNLVTLGWIFFRATGTGEALQVILSISQCSSLSGIADSVAAHAALATLAVGIVITEFIQRGRDEVVNIDWIPHSLRIGIYSALILMFVFCGRFDRSPFIYFSF